PPPRFNGFSWGNLDSQKRSTCAGISRSSATSPIVRNAVSLLPTRRLPVRSPSSLTLRGRHLRRTRSQPGAARAACPGPLVEAIVDLMLQRMRGAEDENAARADRHFLPGLRIAPDALSLLPHREAAEGRDLDHLAALQRVGNLSDDRLDELGRFVTRQADF